MHVLSAAAIVHCHFCEVHSRQGTAAQLSARLDPALPCLAATAHFLGCHKHMHTILQRSGRSQRRLIRECACNACKRTLTLATFMLPSAKGWFNHFFRIHLSCHAEGMRNAHGREPPSQVAPGAVRPVSAKKCLHPLRPLSAALNTGHTVSNETNARSGRCEVRSMGALQCRSVLPCDRICSSCRRSTLAGYFASKPGGLRALQRFLSWSCYENSDCL